MASGCPHWVDWANLHNRGKKAGVLGLILVTVFWSTGCARLTANLQEVEPGAYYRSGQMNAIVLTAVIRQHRIHTVVNLRGASPGELWYRNEIEVCEEQGAAHHDLDWTMTRPPEPVSLQELVSLLNDAEKPMLVHCQGGIHRAAVAAACYRLLHGESVEEAREEFRLFFCNAPIGQLLDLYEESTLPFEEWVYEEYPARYAALGLEECKVFAESSGPSVPAHLR